MFPIRCLQPVARSAAPASIASVMGGSLVQLQLRGTFGRAAALLLLFLLPTATHAATLLGQNVQGGAAVEVRFPVAP